MEPMIVEGAKIMAKGQITLPKDIREKLNVGTGDRVVLIWDEDRVVMMNSGVYAMRALQRSAAGAADRAGVGTEDEVAGLVDEIRGGVSDE
ncbi:AbrB/MazE/SpoVT family DNA-binding domain-containing protein [Isoptericola variabilis]|uniref:Transcriptional regulator, AbrB family n=1 Tax=Isoptericola variabilis (strain 225) TaxID=743718 RepID=F6FRC6_ISOV2|nr:AbrB/MazE/SpoVT family DNA-binding domain-containing protein [Isoptericola variabilis]AEG43887.1 transcriptional regulator, AbrB family [Isoptericola variabilis 225]TWH30478.1 AbrB family looped-hinge helix DNA binding protein [Isoptericola variabilis J7]